VRVDGSSISRAAASVEPVSTEAKDKYATQCWPQLVAAPCAYIQHVSNGLEEEEGRKSACQSPPTYDGGGYEYSNVCLVYVGYVARTVAGRLRLVDLTVDVVTAVRGI